MPERIEFLSRPLLIMKSMRLTGMFCRAETLRIIQKTSTLAEAATSELINDGLEWMNRHYLRETEIGSQFSLLTPAELWNQCCYFA